MSTSTWIFFTTAAVNAVPPQEGVYELGKPIGGVIYIGRSDNLRRRLLEHLAVGDPCLRQASYFRYETTPFSEARERQLLNDYYRTNGRLPQCNDRR